MGLIRHVTLSVQDDDGKPIVSCGVELACGLDTTSKEWFVISRTGHHATGPTEVDAICSWLALHHMKGCD